MKSHLIRLFLFTLAFSGFPNSSTAQLSQKDSLLQASRKLTVEIPSIVGFVNDFELLFSTAKIDSLTKLIVQLNKELDIQIAVVTLDSTYINPNDFDAYSLIIANEWGVGDAKKDNGILIAVSKSLRKIRINNGNGIERILSDKETTEIIQNAIIPYYKLGNYFEGTIVGIEEIKLRILKNR
jgi:uncharacterized protein